MSDAEPGTGLGGDIINEVLPRDHRRYPVIPASHVKGLMRATLQEIAESLQWNTSLVSRVFGAPDDSRPGVEAVVWMSDAVATDNAKARLVTRTAVDVHSGVAKDTTLRTTEALPSGLEFKGTLYTSACAGTVEDLAWRLALMAIRGIGSSRSRGCGACVVDIDQETRTPGALLQELAQILAMEPQTTATTVNNTFLPRKQAGDVPQLSHQTAVLRLIFRARAPICCPDITDRTNVIKTGFSIPASAVQGVILTRLNAEDPALATALFQKSQFRSWPLQPCYWPSLCDETPSSLPISIRVSLTHRMAKFSAPETDFNEQHFFDEALEGPYDWKNASDGAPLKAADGVLLCGVDGTRQLWKASTMPHVITAHGVHNDPESPNDRNLFTVDAMAPLVWQGLLVMPEDAAERLLASLRKNPVVAVGKSRTVRGIGELTADRIETVPPEWKTSTHHTVLVVQSPVRLADEPPLGKTAEQELFDITCEWACHHGLPTPKKESGTWANIGVHFGWNRHRKGRERAYRVILPGSVIAFAEKIDEVKLKTAIQSGIGDGRERGFGAVCVHPGKATSLFQNTRPKLETKGDIPSREAMKLILEMKRMAPRLPSPSQIRAVQQQLLKNGPEAAQAYLDRQTQRTSPIWFTWKPIYESMNKLLTSFGSNCNVVSRSLEVLADLALSDQGEHQ